MTPKDPPNRCPKHPPTCSQSASQHAPRCLPENRFLPPLTPWWPLPAPSATPPPAPWRAGLGGLAQVNAAVFQAGKQRGNVTVTLSKSNGYSHFAGEEAEAQRDQVAGRPLTVTLGLPPRRCKHGACLPPGPGGRCGQAAGAAGREGRPGSRAPKSCLSGPPRTWPSRPPLISDQGSLRGAGVRALEPDGEALGATA